jgi:4-amino-4-deoxy-L-arabinose transferase-like glycosyltransferase
VTVKTQTANFIALLLCALFVCTGGLWIWRPGIQTDEALFAVALWPPFHYPASSIRMFGHDIGVMVMSYIGAVKAWLWAPVFALWGTGPGAIRFPALVVGALSVWCFYRLLLHSLGVRAALAGCALLATDAVYLLTVRWDWGPVALQHLWAVAGMLGVLRWWQTRRLWWLALAFFLFGLGLWDKALFVWTLVGLGAATVIVFPRELWRALSWRAVAVAVIAFGVGSFPFIRYNVRHDWITFRSNAVWSLEDFPQKVELIRVCLNGGALFGSIMRDDWEQPVREPESALERAVVGISTTAGSPRRGIQDWIFFASVLLIPFVWRTPAKRAALFALVLMAVTWVQMAVVKNGGGGAHHTILLWPMPQLVIAGVLGPLSVRVPKGAVLLTAVVSITAVTNLLVVSTYYTNLVRNGATVAWTDAIYPASEALRRLPVEELCTADWGFFDNLRTMHRNTIRLCIADDPATEEGRKYSRRQITNPRVYFITHTPETEIQPGLSKRIEEFAASLGFRKNTVGVFGDSNGRKVIEIFMFQGPSGS